MKAKRKTYLIVALFFLVLTAVITLYPVISYAAVYFSSPHKLSEANVTYAGDIPGSGYVFVYHFETLENGSYNFTGILYFVKSASWGLYSRDSAPSNWRIPFKKAEGLKKVDEVNLILSPNETLVEFFFPRESVYLLNETRPLVPIADYNESGTPNWYFLPGYFGFPHLYAPRGLDAYNRSLAIELNDSAYFPAARYLRAEDGYYLFSAAVDTKTDIDKFEFDRFFPRYVNTSILKEFYQVVHGTVTLQITNIQPLSQDWIRAIKHSYTDYNAPITYVFTLTSIILLILAGRAGG
ncbi:hypothetical protein [Thermococcus waiotapuensis]|uniref:Uncharacterized protein n=1 Tax=Thermococcus waiotapuensis TaxID=90909 RepID=A0AAE4NUF9_9EURY|nr:hypothetical protein [Thermococcus waiotapuensis]MDV3103324.1 hypothetical protein [Thermococcus waiotapuensis]